MKQKSWSKSVKKRIFSIMIATSMIATSFQGYAFNAKAAVTSTNKQSSVTKQTNQGAVTEASNPETAQEEQGCEGDLTPIWTTVEEANEVCDVFDDDITPSINVNANLPSSTDNSQSPYFPKIRSQGSIGSCTCWAEVYYNFTYERCKSLGIPATDENIMSPAFIYDQIKIGSSGSSYGDCIQSLTETGTAYFTDTPFASSDAKCLSWYPEEKLWQDAMNNRANSSIPIANPKTITSPKDSDLNEMKSYLSQGKLITYTTYFNWTRTKIPEGSSHAGEYICTESLYKSSSHRMTIVGYDDSIWVDLNKDGKVQEAEKGAFKIANSWGTYQSNENNGFLWVSYDALNSVSQAMDSSSNRRQVFYSMSVLNDVKTNTSGASMTITLNTARRDQDRITLQAEDANGKKFTYNVFAFNYSWCNTRRCALDGSTSATDGTIVIDLNNVISNITPSKLKDYKWSIILKDNNKDSNPAILKTAEIKVDGQIIYSVTSNLNKEIDGTTATYTFEKSDDFTVKSFTCNLQSPASIADKLKLCAEGENGSGTYQYRFGTIFKGKEIYFNKDESFSDQNTYSTYFTSMLPGEGDYVYYNAEAVGTHTFFVDVKDTGTGNILRRTIKNFVVEGMKITSFTSDLSSPQKAGTSITFNATLKNEVYHNYNAHNFTVTKDGVSKKLNAMWDGGYSQKWTPSEPGTYTITYDVTTYCGQKAKVSMDYVILPQDSNLATVYYNNNSWNDAYIHYKVNNGEWTSVPGVKMENASDMDGYTYKYVIDLGTETEATVCFNNGNGSWDSRNGSNYTVSKGVQGIKNQTITRLDNPATATPTITATPTTQPTATPITTTHTLYFDNSNAKWDKVCAYVWDENKVSTEYVASLVDNSKDMYVVEIPSKYTNIIFKNTYKSWDLQTVDLTIPTGEKNCYKANKGNKSGGTWYNYDPQASLKVILEDYTGKSYSNYVNAKIIGGTAPYTYKPITKSTYTQTGESVSNEGEAHTTTHNNVFLYQPSYRGGDYSIEITVTDAKGLTCKNEIKYSLPCIELTGIEASAESPQKVGTKLNLKTLRKNAFVYKYGLYSNWTITNQNTGKVEELMSNFDDIVSWTPTEAGTYQIHIKTTDNSGDVGEYTTTYTITDPNASNHAIVYYNASSAWNKAFIHYCIAGGSWTSVPGIEMKKTDEKIGYNYKFDLDLGDATEVRVCFNNGNGTWDSKNGTNYTLNQGTYGISNGTISSLN